MRRKFVVQTASLGSAFALAHASFGQIFTDSPINNYTAEIDVNYNQVQSYTETIGLNESTFQTEPDVYWFKYVSNGQSIVTFDTLGSDFGTDGPGGNTDNGGEVLGSYNQSQIAVYTATGSLVAISQNTKNASGAPIAIYPTFSSDPSQYYEPEGLTQLTFEPTPEQNPQWSVSPNNPVPFTGWAAPGNSGNSQKYYPPYFPVALNEYHVWSNALSPLLLDNNGNPVIDPSTGMPYTKQDLQIGWTYSDYDTIGPGSDWDQYGVLPAGTYYVAVASAGPVLSGNQNTETVLEDPVWYNAQTQQNNVPILTSNLGTWQYYDAAAIGEGYLYYGNINLNVTQTPLPPQLSWSNAGGSGDGQTWDNANSQNWNNGAGAATFISGSDLTFGDNNNGHYVVTLNTTVAPGTIYFDNANGNYTISGSGSISGTCSLLVNSTAMVTLATANTYTGGTIVSSGTLVAAASNAIPYDSALTIAPNGVVQLAPGIGPQTLSSLSIVDIGRIDLTNNGLFIDYGTGFTPISYLLSWLLSGYNNGACNGQGIYSSAVADENSVQKSLIYSIGYADGADGITSLPSGVIEILPTLAGDAKLQGNVVFGDFQLLAQYFGQSGTTWDQGDFTYNGNTDFGDFQLLAQNFGANTNGLTAGEISALNSFAARFGDALVANPDGVGFQVVAIPEPMPAALAATAAAGALLCRRRRRTC
jgi:autotransporter-associated beta strand protein